MNTPYWYYNPNVKQANNWGEDIEGFYKSYIRPNLPNMHRVLNPNSNQYTNYGLFGGLGALGGAGIGALMEALKSDEEKNYLKALLIGGGAGAGMGLGFKGIGDLSTLEKGPMYRKALELAESMERR